MIFRTRSGLPFSSHFSIHMGKLCNKPINNLHICFHSNSFTGFFVTELSMLRFYWVKVCDWKHNLIQIFPMDSVNVWGSVSMVFSLHYYSFHYYTANITVHHCSLIQCMKFCEHLSRLILHQFSSLNEYKMFSETDDKRC